MPGEVADELVTAATALNAPIVRVRMESSRSQQVAHGALLPGIRPDQSRKSSQRSPLEVDALYRLRSGRPECNEAEQSREHHGSRVQH